MSSRLFKRIREDLGLAYAVFSVPMFHLDSGLFLVYIGTEPRNARQTIEITREEMARLTQEPLPRETLQIAKEKLKGNLLLGLETSHSRMVRLGMGELYGSPIPLEALIEKIESVTSEDVLSIARALFGENGLSLAMIGPEKELARLEKSLAPA
jgi:predicted Zn-dependent peptidase